MSLTDAEKKLVKAARRRYNTIKDFAPLRHEVAPRYPDGYFHRVFDVNGFWFVPEAESSSKRDPVSTFVTHAPADVAVLLSIIDRLTSEVPKAPGFKLVEPCYGQQYGPQMDVVPAEGEFDVGTVSLEKGKICVYVFDRIEEHVELDADGAEFLAEKIRFAAAEHRKAAKP